MQNIVAYLFKKGGYFGKRIRATAEAKLDPEWERACAMANDLKSKDGTVLWALSFIHAWEDAVNMIKEAL